MNRRDAAAVDGVTDWLREGAAVASAVGCARLFSPRRSGSAGEGGARRAARCWRTSEIQPRLRPSRSHDWPRDARLRSGGCPARRSTPMPAADVAARRRRPAASTATGPTPQRSARQREAALAENRARISKGDETQTPNCSRPRLRRAFGRGPCRDRRLRRLLELNEARCAGGGAVGFASTAPIAKTRRPNCGGTSTRTAGCSRASMPRSRSSAPDKRLKFFNSAFARLWGIEEAWLRAEPMSARSLERLHEAPALPGIRDFRAFKRERLRAVHLADRAADELCICPTAAPC